MKQVSLAEYYDMLEKFDWYYAFSDSHNVWLAGEAQWEKFRVIAEQSPAHAELNRAWRDYMNTGPQFGDPVRAPKPVRPE